MRYPSTERAPANAAAPPEPAEAPSFQPALRLNESLLAPIERRLLVWLAQRLPRWVGPDALTLLGLLGTALAGACYALASRWPEALLLANVCLVVNWFGDSLDGTLARVRDRQRPRYGFYVDHVVDVFGALFLMGGLAASGYVSGYVALGCLAAFLLLAAESYLATYAVGTFRLSHGLFGPTEMRILLGIGNAMAYAKPVVRLFGAEYRFFDVAFAFAAAGMIAMAAASALRNTRALYRAERV